MKTKGILLAALLGFLILSGITFVSSAALSITALWSDSSTSLSITNGDTAYFNYYFVAATTPMSMTIKLYNSTGDAIHTFLDTSTSQEYYYNNNPVPVTSSDYGSNGTYYLVFHLSNANGEYAKTISLTVNPAPAPANNPPTLLPIPNQTVNESDSYTYQTNASDPDGDTLTYALLQAPSWLSINSTGAIKGIAPSVSSDTNYLIKVGVSDNTNPIVTQSYTLTVKHLVVPPQTPDTTPPIISLISPLDNQILNNGTITFSGLVYDNVAVKNVTLFTNGPTTKATDTSGRNDTYYNFTPVFPDGVYTWHYEACDTSGNCAVSASRTFTVDTTPPSVAFTNPTPSDNSVINQSYITANITVSDSGTGIKNETIYLYNSSRLIEFDSSNFTNFTSLPDGTYYLNATAYDLAGNFKSTGTIKITLNTSVSPSPAPSPTQENPSSYTYSDVYTNQYEKQLNQTKPGISLGQPISKSLQNTLWIWILIVGILAVLIAGVLVVLYKRFNFRKKI